MGEYEAGYSERDERTTHAMTSAAAESARKYVQATTHTAPAVCGTIVYPLDCEFDPTSANACEDCKDIVSIVSGSRPSHLALDVVYRMLGMSRTEEIANVPMNAWYSETQAKLFGYAVYLRDGEEIAVTEVSSKPETNTLHRDLVFMGTVRLKDYARTVLGELQPEKGP